MPLSEEQEEEFIQMSGMIYSATGRVSYADDKAQAVMLEKYRDIKPGDFNGMRLREAQEDVYKRCSSEVLDEVERWR